MIKMTIYALLLFSLLLISTQAAWAVSGFDSWLSSDGRLNFKGTQEPPPPMYLATHIQKVNMTVRFPSGYTRSFVASSNGGTASWLDVENWGLGNWVVEGILNINCSYGQYTRSTSDREDMTTWESYIATSKVSQEPVGPNGAATYAEINGCSSAPCRCAQGNGYRTRVPMPNVGSYPPYGWIRRRGASHPNTGVTCLSYVTPQFWASYSPVGCYDKYN